VYTLRPATAEDYDFLFALHCAVIREYVEPIWGWHEAWQAEYFRQKFDPGNRRIVMVGGRDAGVLVVEERDSEIYLALIELLPVFQGHGIGAAIIRDLMAQARQKAKPLRLDVLETNQPAQRLYERLGFRVIGEGEHRRRMIWTPEVRQ
jgi:ribosomal protein S18 acetylase RimI-like enzyme